MVRFWLQQLNSLRSGGGRRDDDDESSHLSFGNIETITQDNAVMHGYHCSGSPEDVAAEKARYSRATLPASGDGFKDNLSINADVEEEGPDEEESLNIDEAGPKNRFSIPTVLSVALGLLLFFAAGIGTNIWVDQRSKTNMAATDINNEQMLEDKEKVMVLDEDGFLQDVDELSISVDYTWGTTKAGKATKAPKAPKTGKKAGCAAEGEPCSTAMDCCMDVCNTFTIPSPICLSL